MWHRIEFSYRGTWKEVYRYGDTDELRRHYATNWDIGPFSITPVEKDEVPELLGWSSEEVSR